MVQASAIKDAQIKNNWFHVSLVSIAAEFLGTALFAFFGGLAPASNAAAVNGLALAVLVWWSSALSGGHLNPW